MTGEFLRTEVTVTNPGGFHMRPITAFVKLAARFVSDVTVSREGQDCNGKSPLDLMLLAAEPGTVLTIAARGPDAPEALAALTALMNEPPSEDDADPRDPNQPDR